MLGYINVFVGIVVVGCGLAMIAGVAIPPYVFCAGGGFMFGQGITFVKRGV